MYYSYLVNTFKFIVFFFLFSGIFFTDEFALPEAII